MGYYLNCLANFSVTLMVMGLLNLSLPGCYRFFLQVSLFTIMEWSLEMVV